MDYPTVIATGTTHLVPLVAVFTIEGTATSTGIAPVATSILDIATAFGGVLLAGITPTSMAFSTVLAPSFAVIYHAPIVILGAYVITAFTDVSAIITHLIGTI